MIISASRRTDLPAFFPIKTIQRILNIHGGKDPVEGVVFWTKNPEPILPYLHNLDDNSIPYYFQYTLNDYPEYIEPGIPPIEKRIETFKKLSLLLGKERVIWRFDPILIHNFPPEGHCPISSMYGALMAVELGDLLAGYTEKLVISFLDSYAKIPAGYHSISRIKQKVIMEFLLPITQRRGIQLATCSEVPIEGVIPNKCIDPELLVRLGGKNINPEKDPSQRLLCGCCKSVDIGKYRTCRHGCGYCYAR